MYTKIRVYDQTMDDVVLPWLKRFPREGAHRSCAVAYIIVVVPWFPEVIVFPKPATLPDCERARGPLVPCDLCLQDNVLSPHV